ncbi:hypothetical protein ONS95_013389 [Cadophora gregata]|uniref:uncharacterized protein n=1 Tax=Cadophora gregata TaxID=51156 RepID=UPI0026DA9A7F|nr:uncharacterized protein ONS95_013389 [Cadophora gregata]KAK0116369.1 hypothetical protein ONS95_013389 [Cadophora gregata]
MVDIFGRIPVKERQWVQHVVAIPGPSSAYMSNAIVVFKGTAAGSIGVFQHEIGHAVDFYKNGFQASGRTEWLDALRKDTCVTDNYANSNAVEAFAQIGVVSLFQNVNPGGLDPAFGWTWHCFLNQITTYNQFQGDSMTPGGVCTRRWSDSAIISTGAAKTISPAARPKPENVLGTPNVFAIPFEAHSKLSVYENITVNQTEAEAAAARQNAWAEEVNAIRKGKRAERFRL